MSIQSCLFGELPSGENIDLFRLTNAQGLKVEILTLGATLRQVSLPGANAADVTITLGHAALGSYIDKACYFGSTIGRVCNRIANGAFELEGRKYHLATNDHDRHHLHGGDLGFDRRVWRGQATALAGEDRVTLRRVSPAGEEGYPGNLEVEVIYCLTDDNRLRIEYTASTDQPTPVNLTNHAFWNLAGPNATILDHELLLCAQTYLPVDETLIPTGEQRRVADSPMDFRHFQRVGGQIDQVPGGYDHCYVLDKQEMSFAKAAVLSDPQSGRSMEIYTTEPGIQFYSGNFLDGSDGQGQRIFQQHGGLCLEAQKFPNSVNYQSFPTTVLKPTETYRQVTEHRFAW